MNRQKTHYHLLGVEPSVSSAEIKRAYRKLVKNYHPDIGHEDQSLATEYMMQLNEAYETLMDGSKRAAYDCTIGLNKQKIVFERTQDSFDEEQAREQYLKEIFHPSRASISRLLNKYQAQLRKLALDVFDDERMSEFESYVEEVENMLLNCSNELSSKLCPKSLEGAVQILRYAIAQAADGLDEMRSFCKNYNDSHLAMAASLFRIAQDLSKESLYLSKY